MMRTTLKRNYQIPDLCPLRRSASGHRMPFDQICVHYPRPIVVRRLKTLLALLPIFVLAAWAPQGTYVPGGGLREVGRDGGLRRTHYYPPPGPPEDPWGPYIRE